MTNTLRRDRLWSNDWKVIAEEAASTDNLNSPNWAEANAILTVRTLMEMRKTAQATRLLAWMTGFLAIATVALAIFG